MRFEKKKVLTAITADEAVKGTEGWFANSLAHMEEVVESCAPTTKLKSVLSDDCMCRFYSTYNDAWDADAWAFFYPVEDSERMLS